VTLWHDWRAYRRFSALPPRDRAIVFYSESRQDWHHLDPLIEALTGELGRTVCHITSDAAVPPARPGLHPFRIRSRTACTWLFQMLKADVMPFLYAPDGPECFGWFKKPITSVAEFVKLRFRISSGLPSDVLKDMGGVPVNLAGAELIPAAERGVIDGVEWINPSNDIKVGLQDVFKFYSIQGLHQAIDIADIIINGAKWKALSPDLQAIVETALTTSIFDAIVYFQFENAKALAEIKTKGVTIFDAPADYAPAFIKSAKKVLGELEKKDAFFKKVLDSQRAYAKLTVPYTRETSKLSTLIAGAAEI